MSFPLLKTATSQPYRLNVKQACHTTGRKHKYLPITLSSRAPVKLLAC